MSEILGDAVMMLRVDPRPMNAGMAAARTSALKQAGATEKALNARMTAMGTRATRIGRTMTRTISLPALAVGGAATKMAFDFQESMERIRNLVGASEKQVDHWGKALLELAPKLGKSPQELADALYFVTSSGIEASKALDVVTVSAKASALGLGETEIVADAVTSAMNSYKDSGLSAARATEVLMQAVKFGKGEPEELAASIGRIIPVAAKLEIPFNDVGSSLAALTLQGLDAAEATTALRGIFTTTLKPSAEAEALLKKVGLSAALIRESLAEEGTLATLQMLSEKFKGNEEAMASMFPNVRALVGAFNLTGGSAETNAKIFEEMEKKTNDVAVGFQRLSETDAHKLRQQLAGLQASGIEIGNELLPVLADIAPTIGDIASAFASMPKFARDLLIGAVILGPAIRAFGALVTAIGGIGGALGRLGSTTVAGRVFGSHFTAGFRGALMGSAGLAGVAALALATLTSGGIKDTLEGHGATWGRDLADSVGREFGPALEEAIRRKSIPALRGLTRVINDYADQVAKVDQEASADLREHADKAERAMSRIQAKISDVRHDIGAFGNTWGLTLNEIDKRTERNMRQIEQSMGKHSRKGRLALADNFFAAADAIRNSIKTGEVNSKEGLKRIEQLMMKALKAYGIKNPAVVLQETERRANAPTANRAMGGGVRVPGVGSGDKVPVTVGGVPVAFTEPGEDLFVLNRTAAAERRQLMAWNSQVPRRANGGFVDLWGRGMAHLARGGRIPGDTGGLQPEVLSLMNQLYRVAGGSVTSGLRPGDDGFHGSGRAADWVGGDWAAGARFINQIGPKLLEGIYNPSVFGGPAVSWDSGSKVPSSFWGGSTWAGHADHIHAAIAAMVEGARMGRIKLPRFEALTKFASSSATALNNISFGLEQRLNPGLSGVGDRGFTMSAGGAFDKGALTSLWQRANRGRGNAGLMAAIALAESSGDPRAVGHDPGGTTGLGLWQITTGFNDDLIAKYGGRDAMFDPFRNAQAAGDILARQGLGAWVVYTSGAYQQFMKRGGVMSLLPGLKEGGIVGLIDRFVGDYKSTEGAGERRKLISETAKRIKGTKQLGVENLSADGGDLGGTLAALRGQADQYGEWASYASSLTTQDAEGNDIPGAFQGKGEADWLRDQLGALFSLRNALTTALDALEKVREKVRAMIERVQKQLRKVRQAIKEGERRRRQLEKERRRLEKDLEDASEKKEKDNKRIQRRIDEEMEKPPKKRDKALIQRLRERLNSKSSEKDAIREQLGANASELAALTEQQDRRTKLRDALKGPISDVLTARNTTLVSGEQTVRDELTGVQGTGFSEEFMPHKPDIGGLGGEIFDVEVSLRDLGAESPEITDTQEPTEPQAFSISELMDFVEAIRYGVFDRDLASMSDLPAFHGGGIVDGPVGTQEVLARLLPGEGYIDAGTMQQGIGQNIYADLYIGNEKIGSMVKAEIRERDRSDRAAYVAGRVG